MTEIMSSSAWKHQKHFSDFVLFEMPSSHFKERHPKLKSSELSVYHPHTTKAQSRIQSAHSRDRTKAKADMKTRRKFQSGEKEHTQPRLAGLSRVLQVYVPQDSKGTPMGERAHGEPPALRGFKRNESCRAQTQAGIAPPRQSTRSACQEASGA